jgi:hypothetical protein
MKLTTHLYLDRSLRMRGDILLRPLYDFMAWAGTNLIVRVMFILIIQIYRCNVECLIKYKSEFSLNILISFDMFRFHRPISIFYLSEILTFDGESIE